MNDNPTQKIEPIIKRPMAEGPAPPDSRQGALGRTDLEQLTRVEDKAARIEEKFARSEALLSRMHATFEQAMAEFSDLARRTDIATLDQRLNRLPGIGALLIVGILAAVLGAGLTLASLKYGIPWPLLAGTTTH